MLTGKMDMQTRFAPDDIRSNFLTTKRLREALEKVEEFKSLAGITEETLGKAALAFVLANPTVSAAIPGARTPEQAEENAASSQIHLPERVVDAIQKKLGGYNFYLRYSIPI
jgi:aryl-alcohol dehydrogenase-like predicted oxidoreductase